MPLNVRQYAILECGCQYSPAQDGLILEECPGHRKGQISIIEPNPEILKLKARVTELEQELRISQAEMVAVERCLDRSSTMYQQLKLEHAALVNRVYPTKLPNE